METLGVLLVWAVIGLVIGAIAKAIMPGTDGSGFVTTSILGIAGAVVGGAIASALGLGSFTGFTVGSLAIAVLGALALLFVYRLVRAT
jgi:uncharacterized membrane protein YeaQ/YmgE (transglycosylase-associated protein family)